MPQNLCLNYIYLIRLVFQIIVNDLLTIKINFCESRVSFNLKNSKIAQIIVRSVESSNPVIRQWRHPQPSLPADDHRHKRGNQ